MATARKPNGRLMGGRFGLGELLIAITLVLCWYLALRPAVDPDYGWHIANGRHVLDGTAFSGRDLYSWTASGLWVVHQWLVEAGMSLVHDRFGATGNSILAASLWTLAFVLVAVRLRARGFTAGPVALTVALGFLCTMMSVGVRPQVLELVYLSLALVLIDRLRQERLKPASFAACMTVLALLWVNTHGSFPLLAVALVLTAAGELIERRSHWRILLVSAALTTAGFLVNPWGYHIISFAIQSMQSAPTLSSIDEWKPPQLGSGSLIPFNVAALLALASVLLFVARRRWHRVDSSGREGPYAADVLVFLAVLYLALQSGRHVMLLGIGAAPLIADMIAHSTSRFPPSEAADPDARTRTFINLAALAFVAVGVILPSGKSVGRAAQDAAMARRYPVELLDEIRQVARQPGRMFNEYSWGGFLIGNGITPVFIDGRSELYGDEQLTRYARIVRLSAGWDTTLDSLQVQSAVLPVDSRLAAALRSQGWRIVAGDSIGVVLVR